MSKSGSYIGGHSTFKHARAWHYEAALTAAAGDEQLRAKVQQDTHDRLSAADSKKAQDRIDRFNEEITRKTAARRSRQIAPHRKVPSVALLKNQNL